MDALIDMDNVNDTPRIMHHKEVDGAKREEFKK